MAIRSPKIYNGPATDLLWKDSDGVVHKVTRLVNVRPGSMQLIWEVASSFLDILGRPFFDCTGEPFQGKKE